ncbi:hypothetical protein DACRYDRAFT_110076 [Dacryopinax primogenitus]|uniref:Uncharacterized protein n=1 Tax=Dacryopinax primogenitus (strain DJM 731) TaxID=1858805 RepID=M5FTG2_DACPD|nr:uncharacterized protein DACRYDRAFT_110076 [Dacryopinax primogenitus]EJT99358.1 hypothetical protein DACRYDRAFT_110076 [Dacryopinax primogenitus]
MTRNSSGGPPQTPRRSGSWFTGTRPVTPGSPMRLSTPLPPTPSPSAPQSRRHAYHQACADPDYPPEFLPPRYQSQSGSTASKRSPTTEPQTPSSRPTPVSAGHQEEPYKGSRRDERTVGKEWRPTPWGPPEPYGNSYLIGSPLSGKPDPKGDQTSMMVIPHERQVQNHAWGLHNPENWYYDAPLHPDGKRHVLPHICFFDPRPENSINLVTFGMVVGFPSLYWRELPPALMKIKPPIQNRFNKPLKGQPFLTMRERSTAADRVLNEGFHFHFMSTTTTGPDSTPECCTVISRNVWECLEIMGALEQINQIFRRKLMFAARDYRTRQFGKFNNSGNQVEVNTVVTDAEFDTIGPDLPSFDPPRSRHGLSGAERRPPRFAPRLTVPDDPWYWPTLPDTIRAAIRTFELENHLPGDDANDYLLRKAVVTAYFFRNPRSWAESLSPVLKVETRHKGVFRTFDYGTILRAMYQAKFFHWADHGIVGTGEGLFFERNDDDNVPHKEEDLYS